jgi:3-carboxy-cis,cis-muconate cycloisomerase
MTSLIRDRAASSIEMLAIFGDEALLAAACRFESALAQAHAAEGLLSAEEATTIEEVCASPAIDIGALAEEAAHAGTLAIALVKHLRLQVAAKNKAASAKLHLGATSQDMADTALMLQVKAGRSLIDAALKQICEALARLTELHAATPMVGRTLLQAALPITFGLKAANWLLTMDAAQDRFSRECDAVLQLQFGGGAGTLSELKGKGVTVAKHLADLLGLGCPPMPWQARRDGIAGLGAALAIVTGAIGKIARDVSLLSQGEVGEAFEPKIAGRGGSSAMAHKRNPTGCQVALSAALRCPALASTLIGAMPQEHERGLGGWQAEAPVLAQLFELTHGALAAMAPVLEALEIDTRAMARNLDAATLGNDSGEAQALIARALAFYRRKR